MPRRTTKQAAGDEKTNWGRLQREWNRVKRQYGGFHPHTAADVIIAAAENEKKAGRAPHYLINLRDVLVEKYPLERPVIARADELCGDCDGVGWVEGGETLQTTCATCKGSGVVEKGVK